MTATNASSVRRATASGRTPTVQALLSQSLQRHRDRACLRWEGGDASYAQTTQRLAALASWLQARTGGEGRVAILLENSREYVETILATALAGRVRVPLNPREPTLSSAYKIAQVRCGVVVTTPQLWEEIGNELSQGGCEVVLVGEETATRGGAATGYEEIVARGGSLDALARAEPDELYRLSFTGGTTGRPKAVMQTHRQELAMMRNLLLEVIRPSPHEVFVAATPLSHASGAFVVPTILAGGSVAWTERFEPARLVDSSWLGPKLGIETFLVPTALADAAQAAGGRHDLTTVVYGGAPCPRATLELAVERLGLCLVQVYGQAEAPMTICVLDRESHRDLAAIEGSPGRPFMFVDVRIEEHGRTVPRGEVGEVVVHAEHTMEGYWEAEQESAERLADDGSVRTQDRGYFDEAGRLRLVGRSRELIISGGFNVFPDEVERRLGELTNVRARCVFSVPHRRWGEAVVLAVVGDHDARLDEVAVLDEVRDRARATLANYEVPKRVVVIDELPSTDVGKVSRAELSKRFEDLFANDDD